MSRTPIVKGFAVVGAAAAAVAATRTTVQPWKVEFLIPGELSEDVIMDPVQVKSATKQQEERSWYFEFLTPDGHIYLYLDQNPKLVTMLTTIRTGSHERDEISTTLLSGPLLFSV